MRNGLDFMILSTFARMSLLRKPVMLIVKYVGIIHIKHLHIFVGKIVIILRTLKDTWKEVRNE